MRGEEWVSLSHPLHMIYMPIDHMDHQHTTTGRPHTTTHPLLSSDASLASPPPFIADAGLSVLGTTTSTSSPEARDLPS